MTTDYINYHQKYFRYAPGEMRKEDTGNRLTPLSAFSIDRLDNEKNFETGLSGTIGLTIPSIKTIKILIFQLLKSLIIKKIKRCQ